MNARLVGLAVAMLPEARSSPEERWAQRTPKEQRRVMADTSRGFRPGATAPVTPGHATLVSGDCEAGGAAGGVRGETGDGRREANPESRQSATCAHVNRDTECG